MQYKITLTDTGKKKVYVNPGVREGIYLYPGEIKKLRLDDGSELEQDEFERIRLEYALPRAKHRAIAILAKRDKTEQDSNLERNSYSPLRIRSLLKWLLAI